MIKFPRAVDPKDGWTIQYAFLCELQEATEVDREYGVELEDVEAVLLGLECRIYTMFRDRKRPVKKGE